jgi:AraC-like DNA-binding protein/DNA-binding CsgD family transcriptional regulator
VTTEHIAHYACYRRGCRRNECRTADRIYRKRYELRRLSGIPSHIPGPVVAAHLRILIDSGHTIRGISREAGMSERAIGYILNGQTNVTRAKALSLLAVRPLAEPPRVAPTGVIRRVQALAAVGWPIAWTAQQAGLHPSYLFSIIGGRVPTIPRHIAARFTAIYREYSHRPGPSQFARSSARRNNWHGPLAWDDIDDPACQPEEAAPYEAIPKYERDPDKTREIEHLYLLGESLEQIAKRFDGNEKYIRDQLSAIKRQRAAKAVKEQAAKAGLERAA